MTLEESKTLIKSEEAKKGRISQKTLDEDGNENDVLRSLVASAVDKHKSRKQKKKGAAGERPKSSHEKDLNLKENVVPSAESPGMPSAESPGLSSRKGVTISNDAPGFTISDDDAGAVLGITLHGCDRLEASPVIFPHPVIQVHVCNSESGKWLQKSNKERKVTSYYENGEVDYILPIMTQPYHLKKNRSLCCQWEEELVFNESITHLTREKPLALLFFQLMDFHSPSSSIEISGNPMLTSSVQGWVTLAWAFLKIRGYNDHINFGNRLRLQLWKPRKSTNVGLLELYSWWKSGSRTKYAATLSVSLHEIALPENPRPSLRSMMVTQQEFGRETLPENLLGDMSEGGSYNSVSEKACTNIALSWSRKPNQTCNIPNFVKHCLPHADGGCLVVKFSHNGLRLACGAHKQILIYEVLTGKLELVFEGHLGLIYDLCWNNEDRLLLSASGDSTVRVWDVEPREVCGNSQTLTHPSHVYVARFVPLKPQLIVTGGYDHMMRVWYCSSSGNYSVVQELTNHLSFVNALCFNQAGDTLFSGDKQGIILVWKVNSPKKGFSRRKTTVLSLLQEMKVVDIMGKTVNSIVYHPGGFRLLVHTRDSQLKLINHKTWNVTHRLSGALNVREQIRGCVSPCGTWVVSGSEDYGIYVWHSDSGELASVYLNLPIKNSISCVDFHPHDHMMVACSYSSKTPILILSYKPETSDCKDTLFNSVLESKGYGISKLIMRDQTLSHIDSESSESPHSDGNDEMYTHNTPSKELQNHLLQSFDPTQAGGMSETMTGEDSVMGKCTWEEVGNKILSNLDNILKMTSEDPLLMENTYNSSSSEKLKPLGKLATVLYDYEARETDELSVLRGDFVMVVESTNKDWWLVKTADMKSTGLVPASYLRCLPEQQHDLPDSGKVIVVPSESGDINFISDTDETPSKARMRRHKANQKKNLSKTVK